MISERSLQRFYPEATFARSGLLAATAFYGWVREIARADMIVLNLGAGGPAPRDPIRVLRGEVARVVGVDVDPEVMKNPEVDEAHIITPGGTLPFDDASFDLVLSDWVVEHIEDPGQFLGEVHRVLRPGGSFFFRTPNKHHYVGMIAASTPHWFHELVANRARGLGAGEHEPWPTYYRLNTRHEVESAGSRAGFRSVEVRIWEGPPDYMVFNTAAFLLGVAYERIVNRIEALESFRAYILARLVK